MAVVYEKRVDEITILHFNPEDPIAGLHRRIRAEDITEDGFEPHRARSAQFRSDLAAGPFDHVTDRADGGERFPSRGISALLPQCEVMRKAGIEGGGGFGAEERRHVGRFDEVGSGPRLSPRFSAGIIKEESFRL